jgi:hypothetical protein
MRPLLLASLLALAAPALAADAPPVISLKVGEKRSLGGGTLPICDDPHVAVITADGRAILQGIGPGETLCSVAPPSSPGVRTLYRVVVAVDAPAKEK